VGVGEGEKEERSKGGGSQGEVGRGRGRRGRARGGKWGGMEERVRGERERRSRGTAKEELGRNQKKIHSTTCEPETQKKKRRKI